MNVDQGFSSRTTAPATAATHPIHEQEFPNDDNAKLERPIPDSYHHSSYEYLSSSNGLASASNPHHPFNSSNNLTSSHPTSAQKPVSRSATSTSYSPATYRYPTGPVLDEHSPIHRATTNQPQQLSNSSLSAYAPQHLNPNRYSALPTTSDDSGNESSIHYQQQQQQHLANTSTANSHFVVVAIDFGTTFSGYAFAFTRDIDSILMMRKVDGNDPGLWCCLVRHVSSMWRLPSFQVSSIKKRLQLFFSRLISNFIHLVSLLEISFMISIRKKRNVGSTLKSLKCIFITLK